MHHSCSPSFSLLLLRPLYDASQRTGERPDEIERCSWCTLDIPFGAIEQRRPRARGHHTPLLLAAGEPSKVERGTLRRRRVARVCTIELELIFLDRGLPADPRLARRHGMPACVRESGRHRRGDGRVGDGLTVVKASLSRLATSEVAKAVTKKDVPHQHTDQNPDARRLTGSGNSYNPSSPGWIHQTFHWPTHRACSQMGCWGTDWVRRRS